MFSEIHSRRILPKFYLFKFFFLKYRYNWHIILCKFKVYICEFDILINCNVINTIVLASPLSPGLIYLSDAGLYT